MSYYTVRPAGDYKTYGYAGDPGFLSSLWKGIKTVGKIALGAAIGGPVGGVIAGTAGGGRSQTPMQFPVPPGTLGGAVSFPGGVQVSGAFVPGGSVVQTGGRGGKFGGRGTAVAPYVGGAGACPTGYHLAKDGSGKCVRNRRMNVANPRALRRSMRRVQGFEKLARRTITFTRRTRMKKRKSS
jgi:hypothetical protein